MFLNPSLNLRSLSHGSSFKKRKAGVKCCATPALYCIDSQPCPFYLRSEASVPLSFLWQSETDAHHVSTVSVIFKGFFHLFCHCFIPSLINSKYDIAINVSCRYCRTDYPGNVRSHCMHEQGSWSDPLLRRPSEKLLLPSALRKHRLIR